ncbi:MAG: hypothetical protein IPK19_29915 [Chloroflexi bacterium]|nr:hypothetical protein [Chloroflexota bacterium]
MQLLVSKTITIPANGSVTEMITIPTVPAGSLLTVSLLGSYVDSVLLDPSLNPVDSITTTDDEAGEPFRSLYASDPAAGHWSLQLHNPSSEPITLLLSVTLDGDPIGVTLNVGVPDPGDQVPLTVSVTQSGSPVTGAVVSATTRSTDGIETALALMDDGAHGDGSANDGIYGGMTAPLPPGLNTVSVGVQTAAFSRQAVGHVNIAFDNQPPEAGDDTANTTVDTSVSIDVLANDTDDQAVEQLSIVSVTLPATGQVINDRDGITFPAEGSQGMVSSTTP